MPTLTIDSKVIQVPPGTTVLEAARGAGLFIPTLCDRPAEPGKPRVPPATSCMLCVVKVHGASRLMPACGLVVTDQMQVESQTAEVLNARRVALELLLSDHEGPCVAPCQAVCPAHMHIDQMLNQIAMGNWRGAIETVKEAIPLPATLGRICPDLCEKGCRRKFHDEPVSICQLKRETADRDLASAQPYRPAVKPATGKRVAIVGGGPAGLSAAYYLAQTGHAVTLFDRHAELGGSLWRKTTPAELPREVLQKELAQIQSLPITFVLGRVADPTALRLQHDAVLIAGGSTMAQAPAGNRITGQTAAEGVFVVGAAGVTCKYVVQAVGDGRFGAQAVAAYLAGLAAAKRKPEWSCLGPVPSAESLAGKAAIHCCDQRQEMPRDAHETAKDAWAAHQADRCLRCGCAKQDNCTLRDLGAALEANPGAFRGERRPSMPIVYGHLADGRTISLDNGKCIACGKCVAITQEMGEEYGLTWIGRGFSVHVGPALGVELRLALTHSAAACAEACPTAALMLQ